MALKTTILPTSFLRRMAPEDRKPMGKAGLLPEEVDLKKAKIAEKKLQEQCESFLRRNDMFYLRMPMHKPTSIRVGWPDFTILLRGGRSVLIEVKVDGGRIEEDQHKLHEEFARQTGQIVFVVWNYDQFLRVIQGEMNRWNQEEKKV